MVCEKWWRSGSLSIIHLLTDENNSSNNKPSSSTFLMYDNAGNESAQVIMSDAQFSLFAK